MKKLVFEKIKDINSLMGKTLDYIRNYADSNYYYKLDRPYNYSFKDRTIENPVIADYFCFRLYEYNYYNKIIKEYDLIFNNACICINIIELSA